MSNHVAKSSGFTLGFESKYSLWIIILLLVFSSLVLGIVIALYSRLFILIVPLILFGVVVLRRPLIILMILPAIILFYPLAEWVMDSQGSGVTGIGFSSIYLLLVMLLVFRVILTHSRWKGLKGQTWLIMYVSWSLFSLAIAIWNGGDVIEKVSSFVMWIVPFSGLYMTTNLIRTRKDLLVVFYSIVVTISLLLFFSLFQVLEVLGYSSYVPSLIVKIDTYSRINSWWHTNEVFGTFINLGPDLFANTLAFVSLWILSFAVVGNRLRSLFLGSIVILAAVVIIFTGSRAAVLGLLTGSGVILLLIRKEFRVPRILLIGLFAVVLLLFVENIVSDLPYFDFFVSDVVVRRFLEPTSLNGRYSLWSNYLNQIVSSPIWGYGFDAVLKYSGGFHIAGLGQSSLPAENQFIRELFDKGLIGLVLFITMLVRFAKEVSGGLSSSDLVIRQFSIGYLGGLVGLTVTMIFGDVLSYPTSAAFFWFITGVCLAAQNIRTPLPVDEFIGSGTPGRRVRNLP